MTAAANFFDGLRQNLAWIQSGGCIISDFGNVVSTIWPNSAINFTVTRLHYFVVFVLLPF